MASTINASTSPAAIVQTADGTANLSLQSNGTTIAALTSTGMAVTGTLSASGVTTFAAGTAALPAITTTGDTDTGIWFPAANTVAASTSGTEAMRIDSSGNVGIGTTSPVTKLTVSGGNGNAITSTNTGSQYSGFEIANNGTNKVTLSFDNTNGIAALNTRGANAFTFGTSDTERMRIDTSGNLLVGATTQAAAARGTWQTAANNYRYICFQSAAGAEIGYIYNNTTATQYSTSSDYRLKEDVKPMVGALDTVALLKPVTYKWKIDGSDGQGFIAHELQEVVPDCVTGEKDAVDAEGNPQYQGIDTSFLVATLTAAIQEQQALITSLTARITALEGA